MFARGYQRAKERAAQQTNPTPRAKPIKSPFHQQPGTPVYINYPQSTQIEGTDAVFDILLLISVAAEMSADVSLRS
jgi:hypothetical protein